MIEALQKSERDSWARKKEEIPHWKVQWTLCFILPYEFSNISFSFLLYFLQWGFRFNWNFFLHPLYLEHKHTIGSQLVFHVSFICFSLNYSLHEILFVPFFHRISLVIFSCNSRYLAVVMTWNSIAFFINLMGWIFDLSLDRKGNANNIQLGMQHFSCRISNEICG